MSCNRDGVQCQPAAHAVGGGDTELVQMTGRRSAGNCPQCGQFIWPQTPHSCPPSMSPAGGSIEAALNKAIAADERRNFIIVDGVEEYFPMLNRDVTAGVTEVQRLSRNGGTAALYVYEKKHHPANDPRKPVAIFHDGQPGMVTAEARKAIDVVDWRDTSEAVHAIMDRLSVQSEIPTAGRPAEVFEQLGYGRQSEELRYALVMTKDIAAARADEGVGFSAKDAAPLWAAYETELDRRIGANAGPAILAVYDELGRDYWEDGYTEAEVTEGCRELNRIARDVFGLPGEIGVMWNDNDEFGFGGDSELVYLRRVPGDPDRPEWGGAVEAYSLSSPFLADSNPADFIIDLRRIARREATPNDVYDSNDVTSDSYNWGPWAQQAEDEDDPWAEADDSWENEEPWDLNDDQTVMVAIPDLPGKLGLSKTFAEAKRVVQQGGYEIDGEKIDHVNTHLLPAGKHRLKFGKSEVEFHIDAKGNVTRGDADGR